MRTAAPYSYAFLDVVLQKHFSAPPLILQVHALLLTSGALSLSRSAFPYNCLIHAHLRLSPPSSRPPCAPLRLFSAMLAAGVSPKRHTFPSLLKAAATAGSVAATAAMHAQCLRRGMTEDRFVACSLLSSYAAAARPVDDARKVFDEIASPDLATCNAMLDVLCLTGELSSARCLFEQMVVRDVVSWTTIISGLSRNGYNWDAVEMFRGLVLENKGCLPEATLVSILPVFAHFDGVSGLVAGMSVHAYVVRHEVNLSAFLGTALIDMYGKHGQLACCRSVFQMVREKEVCSWNALMSALANHGKETEAFVQFDKMRVEGLLPDHITFVAVLTACARSGLVEIGLRWFEAMVSEFKLNPLMVHYGCVVDLLGRAGHFMEALQIIKRMPFMADASVWSALIGACKLHGNVELAAQIRQKLIALDPQQSGRYMTIRNIYLEEGNWHAAMRMGEVMQVAGVRKIVGQSSVISHGQVIP